MKANESIKKKVVLIIGNGFDLDMHYVTTYDQFVKSEYFSPLIGGKTPMHVLIQGKDADKMMIHPNGLAKYIADFEEHNNWVDLEICVRDYCKAHVNDNDKSIIEKEFYALRFFLYHFISHAYRARNDYDKIGQTNKEVAYVLMDSIAHSNADWNIWSFNYTKICEDILGDFKVDSDEIKTRVHHIHGTVYGEYDTTNIVLGTGYDSEVLNVCPDSIKSQWRKYTPLKNLYDKQVQEADHIIIMGHSIGETDTQYFRHILDSSNLQTITLLTNNTRSLNNIKRNLDIATNSKLGQRIEDGDLKLLPFVSSEFSSIGNYYEIVHGYGLLYVSEDSITKLKKLLEESYN